MKRNWRHRNNNRNVALILIGVGIYLLFNNHFGFFTVMALLFILFGINKIRSASIRKGYIFIGIGLVILIGGNLSLLLSVVLISLGYFYIRSRQLQRDDKYVRKQSLIDSIRWGREPWVLRSSSIWNVLGELQIDLTYAIPEQPETTIVLQGVIADVDIIVPEDMGLSVTAWVLFGQSDIGPNKEAGVFNKTVWQSANYETADTRVELLITYVVADIDIKVV
ncbi:cell wall-active antibiotics response protein LiaF [Paenibacillus doosanensis]|uniref:Cell wall-active antibiotics response LiaF-like C-terminal domain-containing protein n=1 Tax=Paenibacillus konkukensis TaxID=2020716 RepID=A0ABY4RMB9_9BACL|nr:MULTISPECIES: cell wall-active antibiotics response protein LiaF [Paenibacillus]MCS7461771.1 cell wall-active antibiotics response protein LiaF [Paenibacillus doosanensis]UQZ83611.1 hypothetical protein SK3146_02798 [Paenibacillus konkukensis]